MPDPPGVAVVTGASRGIGAAIARRCARDGYVVAVNYASDSAGALQTVADIVAAGGSASAIRADVSIAADVVALFDRARALGEVTAVVNNAGITGNLIGPLADVPADVLQRVTEVNVVGPLLVSREAVLRMSTLRGGTGGQIINISSTATRAGSPGTWVHYAATKGAVDVLTVGLASEVGREGIRVNCVSPGSTNTGLHAAAGMPDRAERLSQSVPLGRPAEPDEVAAAVAWLLSAEATYITGAILPVSGGR
ncbi:SDR family oxidoreductase [Arthrobacter sp. Hz1]